MNDFRISPEKRARASYPAFRSTLYIETKGVDADVKVDWDCDVPTTHLNSREFRGYALVYQRKLKTLRIYETTKGFHLRVWTAKPWAWSTIIKAQKELLDDPMRQMFNRRRIANKEAGWNVLWNKKLVNNNPVMEERIDWIISQQICESFGCGLHSKLGEYPSHLDLEKV